MTPGRTIMLEIDGQPVTVVVKREQLENDLAADGYPADRNVYVTVAVEFNCRPERRDPPGRLLRLAIEAGCVFAIDTDAHAPGQLDWLGNGVTRAEKFGIPAERVINTRSAGDLLAWTALAAG